VKERLGPACEGWTKRKAEIALRARLTDVERDGYRKPEPVTFATFAREWVETYPSAKGLKSSGYETIVEGRLIPALGTLQVADVSVERAERLVSAMRREGLSGATCNRVLNVLSLILRAALKRGLIRTNVVSLVDRPREGRSRWRILSPAEVRAVENSFDELICEAANEGERVWRETCRTLFLVVYGLGLRRGELLGLRWRHVRLADPDGATIRIEETHVRGRTDTPKSERSVRTLAVGPRMADVLFEHRARTAFAGDDERVFCNPKTGGPLDPNPYAVTFRLALTRAKVEGHVRPFHDGRHASITNAAAAGTAPAALMARAGHADLATTQRYIDLAGEVFRNEAELLEKRLWGESGTRNRYQVAEPEPVEETTRA
jgi:integrase